MLTAVLMLLTCGLTGCSQNSHTTVPDTAITGSMISLSLFTGSIKSSPGPEKAEIQEMTERISDTCKDILEEAVNTNTLDSLETMRHMVERLGEHGYAAVDSENQINMTNADKAVQFCEAALAKESAELALFVADYAGGFTTYYLTAENGNLSVTRAFAKYTEGSLTNTSIANYEAQSWSYTEEGYLMFKGRYDSEISYALTMSDVAEQTALRILPLEEELRELNRQYIRCIGYGKNNMFLLDWNKDDFASLNFYDAFDAFYPLVFQHSVPYMADDNLGVGAVYQIPGEEFEHVIQTYLPIDSKTLREKTIYSPEDDIYTYRPRGFYETEYPDLPYPEVVDCEKNADGTITLTVNAVYPERETSRAYVHKVIVCPLENGGVQYVSNQRVWFEDGWEIPWHTERLSGEEWEEIYGSAF